jgi:hypothetical protein
MCFVRNPIALSSMETLVSSANPAYGGARDRRKASKFQAARVEVGCNDTV